MQSSEPTGDNRFLWNSPFCFLLLGEGRVAATEVFSSLGGSHTGVTIFNGGTHIGVTVFKSDLLNGLFVRLYFHFCDL